MRIANLFNQIQWKIWPIFLGFRPTCLFSVRLLVHAQLQSSNLLAVWESGGHLRVCDTMPPVSVIGDDNLTWKKEGAGIWEAIAEEPGELLLQVSINELPRCTGTLSQDGQYYPALEVQDGFPKGKISGNTQAVMLRVPQKRRQNKRSISEEQEPALSLPFADWGLPAARAAALLGAGVAGGFFQQFPPRPPFPGFPYQGAKSQQDLTTAILVLLFMAQGYLPFPDSPEQPLIHVGGDGESVALYQDDLLWLVQHFHLDSDNFQEQLSARLSHTLWLGGPIADWFQYEAQQRKKQAMTQMCNWLTRIKTTTDNFITFSQVTETGEFDDFIAENKLIRSLTSIFSRAREEGVPIHQLPAGKKSNEDVIVKSASKSEISSSESHSLSHRSLLSGTKGSSNNDGDGATPPISGGYACVSCERRFLTPTDLKQHENDLHSSSSDVAMEVDDKSKIENLLVSAVPHERLVIIIMKLKMSRSANKEAMLYQKKIKSSENDDKVMHVRNFISVVKKQNKENELLMLLSDFMPQPVEQMSEEPIHESESLTASIPPKVLESLSLLPETKYDSELGTVTYTEAGRAREGITTANERLAGTMVYSQSTVYISVERARELVQKGLKPGEVITFFKRQEPDYYSERLEAVADLLKRSIEREKQEAEFVSIVLSVDGYTPRRTLNMAPDVCEIEVSDSELIDERDKKRNTYLLSFSSLDALEALIDNEINTSELISSNKVSFTTRESKYDTTFQNSFKLFVFKVLDQHQKELPDLLEKDRSVRLLTGKEFYSGPKKE